MKYLVIRHNTCTHCVFQQLFYPCQFADFMKEHEANIAEGYTHIKILAVIPVQDDEAFLHDTLDDHTSDRWNGGNK